jgi:tRNA(fMet)-specific endonuclease VapC
MYILDTDHLSLIQRNGTEGKQILAKLAVVEESEVVELRIEDWTTA